MGVGPAQKNMDRTEEIKNSGLKATLPRIKILEIFQTAAQRHMTAEDVYKALLNEGPISAWPRSTVC